MFVETIGFYNLLQLVFTILLHDTNITLPRENMKVLIFEMLDSISNRGSIYFTINDMRLSTQLVTSLHNSWETLLLSAANFNIVLEDNQTRASSKAMTGDIPLLWCPKSPLPCENMTILIFEPLDSISWLNIDFTIIIVLHVFVSTISVKFALTSSVGMRLIAETPASSKLQYCIEPQSDTPCHRKLWLETSRWRGARARSDAPQHQNRDEKCAGSWSRIRRA